jgi:rhodanese-related sulfurtransferase/polyisoprenoid-binding protein YceI
MSENKKYKSLAADELMERIKNKEPLILIDTLTGSHFEKVHLPGARSACVFEVTFLDQVKAIVDSKKAEIIFYGSSGRSRDALTAAEKLQRKGYINISVLNGGLEAWRERGFELQGDQPDMADPETILRIDDGRYTADIDKSIIEWSGRNPNTKHFGTVGIKSGQVEVNNANLTGVFEIDMEAIDNINLKGDELHPVLTSHLKSDDFFFVKMFPTATLTITEGRAAKTPFTSSPNYDLKAILELRGVKADLAFQATVTKTEDGGLTAEAHFDIDRTRWKVIYGSARFFENLGMHLVFDPISIQVKIATISKIM